MAPEVFKHRRYEKKVDVYSFAMILYEVILLALLYIFYMTIFEAAFKSRCLHFMQMLEGEPPFASYEPYDGAKHAAEGHRPAFRAKGYIPELQE
jgi:serine/threonine protein kinase